MRNREMKELDEEMKAKKDAINMLLKLLPEDVPGIKVMTKYSELADYTNAIVEKNIAVLGKEEEQAQRIENFMVELVKLVEEFIKQENIEV